jgi:hypothetical protein
VLTEDDFAISAIDLADCSRAVGFMPALLEAEHVDIETKSTVYVGDEEDRARVPASLVCHSSLRHSAPV